MTDQPTTATTADVLAAARRRDFEATLIEPAATALAVAAGSTAFSPDLPDTQLRAKVRDVFRRQARTALAAAGAFDAAREVRHLRVMDRISSRHALKAEQEVAEVAAKLANREAEVARVEAKAAGLRLELHDAQTELARLREANPRHVIEFAEDGTWSLEHPAGCTADACPVHAVAAEHLPERVELRGRRLACWADPTGDSLRLGLPAEAP